MMLFDYRTDHYDDSDDSSRVAANPTFLYAMPMKDDLIFFEETSLVANPAVSMQDCKTRLYKRLAHLGIKVSEVLEEEFCYIPMGGGLPSRGQRIVPLGGAASMSHPSTGYTVNRMLAGSIALADAIRGENIPPLRGPGDGPPDGDEWDASAAAARCFDAVWTPAAIKQRNFAVFGGDFLMKQNVVGLRGFFVGFFRLPVEYWGGFLSHYPGLPNNDKHNNWAKRLWFGEYNIIHT